MSDFEVRDNRFRSMFFSHAPVERLYTGTRWAEGPVYFGDGDYVLWSDIPNNRILRWTPDGHVGVFREPSNYTNGHTRDRQGRLISCEHGGRRVTRTEWDGTISVLADRYRGGRLNSPNDVIVRSDGTIWFTDPSYGILSDYEGYRSQPEIDGCYVYRLDPSSGDLTVVADDFDKPNGLAFSTDETVLYVSDTGRTLDDKGRHHIRAFDVVDGRTLRNGRALVEVSPGVPDGLRVDEEDYIWSSAGDGVHCYAPEDGALLGKIRIPEVVSNCVFGGGRRNRLFITASTSLYAVYLNRRGAAVV